MSGKSLNKERNEPEQSDEAGSDQEDNLLILDGNKYFKKIGEEGGKIVATCISCQKASANSENVLYKKIEYRATRQSKTNFITHLQRLHSDLYKEYLTEIPSKRRKLNYHKYEMIDLKEKQSLQDKLTIEFLVQNYLPPHIMNNSFENLIHNLNSQIIVKNAQQLQIQICKTRNNIKQSFIEIFENVSFISLTVNAVEIDEITYLLIACFWIDTTDLDRKDALLACKISQSSSLDTDCIVSAALDVMDEYGIKRQKVSSVVVNDTSEHYEDFSTFINNPNDFPICDNHYAIPDSRSMKYTAIDLNQDHGLEIKLENSLSYEIIKFAIGDFITFLNDNGKLDFHYEVLSKLNKIWNAARDNPDIFESICGLKIEGPAANIRSLYESIIRILSIADKISMLRKKLEKIPVFKDSEINYASDLATYFKLINDAIEALENNQNGHYGK